MLDFIYMSRERHASNDEQKCIYIRNGLLTHIQALVSEWPQRNDDPMLWVKRASLET